MLWVLYTVPAACKAFAPAKRIRYSASTALGATCAGEHQARYGYVREIPVMRPGIENGWHRWIALLVLLVCGVLLARPAVAADADTIVLVLNRDQDNMDPHMHFQRVGIIMNINMYDSLLHKNTKLEYEPSLATAWKTLDDTTWEFTLRQGVKFHNGDPFSAEDVKFSFERVLDP